MRGISDLKVYNHSVEPERYPAFTRRGTRVVTRGVLDNKIQFSACRFIPVDKETNRMIGIDEKIRLYTEDNQLGNCFWLHRADFLAENFDELVAKLKEKGLYLYGAWGFIPGTDSGNLIISEETNALLERELGERFFGYEMGEQDGRYIGAFTSRTDSTSKPKSRREQRKAFDRFFNKIARQFYGRMTVLCALTTPHYYAQSGYATLLSCETAQRLPNAQMWYAFQRGASKQYGILCMGNVSIWNRDSYKIYGHDIVLPGGFHGSPEHGTSLSLLRRILYSEYMYGCDVLGLENGFLAGEDHERHQLGEITREEAVADFPLSPIGALQQHANLLIQQIGRPGVMHTPVALLMDANSGWMPARQGFTRHTFEAWGNIPYHAGDHQTHALFTMWYPQYENAGFYQNENGFLCETPYGEIADVLLSDADGAVLNRYQLLFVTNDTPITLELYHKIRAFAENGGHIVVCAPTVMQAANVLSAYDADYAAYFGLQKADACLHTETGVAAYGGNTYPVKDLQLADAVLPKDAKVVASVNGKPAIVEYRRGQGRVTVLLAGNGLERKDPDPLPNNDLNHDIGMPLDFSPFIKAYLHDRFEELVIVKPTNPQVQYIVTVRDTRTVRLLVSNNTTVRQRFDIVGGEVSPAQVRQIAIDDHICEAVGYYPSCVTVDSSAEEGHGGYAIDAGDVQLFEIVLSGELSEMAEQLPIDMATRRGVRMPTDYKSISDFLVENPTFTHYFDTVLVSGDYMERTERETLKNEAIYLKQIGVKLAVDLTDIFNMYPDLTFDLGSPIRCAESYRRLDSILEKVRLFVCDSVFATLTSFASPGMDRYKESMIKGWQHIVEQLKGSGIRTVFQNRTMVLQPDVMFKLAKDVPDLALALNTSAALSAEWPIDQLQADFPISYVLAAAPVRNIDGRLYNAFAPIRNSEFEETICRIIRQAQNEDTTVFLSADYEDWNAIYADYCRVFGKENDDDDVTASQ